jgi:hypothetical protein
MEAPVIAGIVSGAAVAALGIYEAICWRLARRRKPRDQALVLVYGKTEFAKRLFSMSDASLMCVDVEGETINSLTKESQTMLEGLQTTDPPQYRRMLTQYCKVYVESVRRTYTGARFLFLVSSSSMAANACGVVKPKHTRVALPSGEFSAKLTATMKDEERASFDSSKMEALRGAGGNNLVVFADWDSLYLQMMFAYRLSPRL